MESNKEMTEEEKTKCREADEYIRDEIEYIAESVRKQVNISAQIRALGLPEDMYWRDLVEDTGEKSTWRKTKEFKEYVKQLDEQDITPKQKLDAAIRYLGIENAIQERKRIYANRTKSLFHNFGQFNYKMTEILEQTAVKNGLAVAIFLYLARKSDGYNKVVCSYKTLQKEFKKSSKTVARAITLLEEQMLITVYKNGTANEYVLNDTVTWKSRPAQHEQCRYNPKVIKERSEKREKRKEKGKEVAARKKEKKKAEEDAKLAEEAEVVSEWNIPEEKQM